MPPTPDTLRVDPADKASRALAKADPLMAELIARVGAVEFAPGTDRFSMLVRGIVGQQLSGAAARSIFERLRTQVGESPEALAGATDAQLLSAGLSRRKAEYVRDLAREVLGGDLDLDALDDLSDAEIERRLVALRGVGPWTAHMFLLFAMRRPNVIAPGDLGIRQAVGRLLALGREATPEEVVDAAQKWRPYRSTATLYLYREAGMGRAPVEGRAER